MKNPRSSPNTRGSRISTSGISVRVTFMHTPSRNRLQLYAAGIIVTGGPCKYYFFRKGEIMRHRAAAICLGLMAMRLATAESAAQTAPVSPARTYELEFSTYLGGAGGELLR